MITTISARVLGQRIRQLRTRRGLTQQDLAGEDYSKSYISAIEQGKTRPSLEALQRIASRLDIPAGNLLDPDAPGFVPADPESMPRRVRRRRGVRAGTEGAGIFDPAQQDLQIAQAELFLYTGQAAQALESLRALLPEDAATGSAGGQGAASPTGPNRPLDPNQLQRAYYLASQAAAQAGNASDALSFVQRGMQLATRMGDREGLERLRLVLGIAYFQADQPLSALEQHRMCLEAISAGVVRDPNFKLRVLSNIAADYWALHDNERAVATYRSGVELLDQLNSIERQAGILWDVATNYGAERQYAQARSSAARAISIYEALENIHTVARMEGRYGNILVETGEVDQAEGYLRHSLELAESLDSPADKATALSNLARLELRRGNLEQASALAAQAVETSRTAAQGDSGSAQRQPYATGANDVLAGALALSGEIAAQRDDTRGSDKAFKEAIKLLESGEGAESASDIYRRYAQVLAARGQHEQASRFFERAYEAVTRRGR